MGRNRVRNIGILTSSRADYGIYIPLLKQFNKSSDFTFDLIVFGTHLSQKHGYTVENIINDGFAVNNIIETAFISDSPLGIAQYYAETVKKFADFWDVNRYKYDLVLALGDRYEMAAAVAAGIPFGVSFGHLHGGETTLGAIDNIYRHCISLASKLHFVSSEIFKERLQKLLGESANNIYNVGALGLENIENTQLLSINEFYNKWGIDLNKPSILVTVHPETVNYDNNKKNAGEINLALKTLSTNYQIIITMPNADTSGLIFRELFIELSKNIKTVYCIENFGTQSYFTCMKHANLLLGNTSSGIVEAASFKKYVINLGDRQKGRLQSENVINLPFNRKKIENIVPEYIDKLYEGRNIYYKEETSKNILEKIRAYFG